MNNLTVGKKIKLLRVFLDLNQSAFADKIGEHMLTVYKFEAGKKEPTDEQIKRIETIFGYHLDSIVPPRPY